LQPRTGRIRFFPNTVVTVYFDGTAGKTRLFSCYKFAMAKTIGQLLLFKYVGREINFLSKAFKTKRLAEKARSKFPERERKTIGSVWFESMPRRRGMGGKPGYLAVRVLGPLYPITAWV
jgi:hypothetical protein